MPGKIEVTKGRENGANATFDKLRSGNIKSGIELVQASASSRTIK